MNCGIGPQYLLYWKALATFKPQASSEAMHKTFLFFKLFKT
jgi:hypothetical protein